MNIIERAFQLARSGECPNVDAIRRRLRDEHFEGVDNHLGGPSLRRELAGLCKAALITDPA